MITPEFIDRAFHRRVEPEIFAEARPSEAPVLVMLGGQPGAGKSQAMNVIAERYPDAVEVVGDDFRRLHPEFLRLVHEDPMNMPAETASVSGPMVRRCLDHALETRCDVVLEGTFRDERMVTATAREFAAAGYRVEVVAVATPPAVSTLSAEHRYLSAAEPWEARWTPPAANIAAIEAAPHVLGALERLDVVARVEVRTRADVLYVNERDQTGAWTCPPQARQVLEQEWDRWPGNQEATRWLADYERLRQVAVTRPDYLSGPAAETWKRLDQIAERSRAILEGQRGLTGLGEPELRSDPTEQAPSQLRARERPGRQAGRDGGRDRGEGRRHDNRGQGAG